MFPRLGLESKVVAAAISLWDIKRVLELAQTPRDLVLLLLVLGAGLLVFVVAFRYPSAGLVLLLISVALSGNSVELHPLGLGASTVTSSAGLTLRPEYVVVPMVALGLILGKVLKKERIRLGRATWYTAWLGANVLSTMLVSPDRSYSFRMLYFFVVGGLAYLWFVNYVEDRASLERSLRIVALVIAGEAIFAVTLGGRWLDMGVVRLHGSLLEPVIFGDYCVPLALLLLSWAVARQASGEQWVWPASAGLSAAILGLLSMSRAAWLGLAAGAALLLVLVAVLRVISARRAFFLGAGGVILAVGLILSWSLVASHLYTSFGLVVTSTGAEEPQLGLQARLGDVSANMRTVVARQVIQEAKVSPLIGHGTLAYGIGHVMYAQPTGRGWIPTGLLLVLYDTGLLGVAIFTLMIALILFDLWRAMRAPTTYLRSLAAGAFAGLLAWLFMDQFATSMIVAFTWTFVGLAAAIASLAVSTSSADSRDTRFSPLFSPKQWGLHTWWARVRKGRPPNGDKR